jgi:hypothetical protein
MLSTLVTLTASVYDCNGSNPDTSKDSLLASGSCSISLGACSGDGVISLAEPDGAPAGSLTFSLQYSSTVLAFEDVSMQSGVTDPVTRGSDAGDEYGDEQFEDDGYADEGFESEASEHDNQHSFIETSELDIPPPPPEPEPELTTRQPKHTGMTDSTLQLMKVGRSFIRVSCKVCVHMCCIAGH